MRAEVAKLLVKVRFLLDENLSPKLKTSVLRLNPAIDILRVGDAEAPLLGTLDPDILRYLELSQRMLVTDNRKSMPEHLEEHWGDGGHIWGLVWLRSSGEPQYLGRNNLFDLGSD
ncbi:DUF5615 family PIN-like protein [Nostoc sp. LPT]|uniref:DUF5615 family PIN-like protein n=1 Tax=Nostoc sp. LPT TaxID=2815387 RepID=UPI0025D525D2|nr:DUF5615 family PIN-like protein [Nostoc sp. LPT]